MNFTQFHQTFRLQVLFIVNSLMVLGIQTLKTQHWKEVSWQNNVDNAKFIVETRLDNDFPIELTYFQ